MGQKKLNVGCGRDIRPGFTNLDIKAGPGVDVVCDVDVEPLPFEDNYFDRFLVSHLLEHLRNPLHTMGELWRVAKPGALLYIFSPHGASDDAWEDQTHLRAYFPNSFQAFGQPYYRKADYGYRGDWETKEFIVDLTPWVVDKLHAGEDLDHLMRTHRNVIIEMRVVLEAHKPARNPNEATESVSMRIGPRPVV